MSGLALGWQGMPSYERLLAFAKGIAAGLKTRLDQGLPVHILLDGDVAMTLGAILKDDIGVTNEILVIDGLSLRDFDFIDIGRIRVPSLTVPVTIKSLVFSETPNARRNERIHHHGHGHHHHHHDHDHSHDHDHKHAHAHR
jgi:ethanolamine utilization protein EutA